MHIIGKKTPTGWEQVTWVCIIKQKIYDYRSVSDVHEKDPLSVGTLIKKRTDNAKDPKLSDFLEQHGNV